MKYTLIMYGSRQIAGFDRYIPANMCFICRGVSGLMGETLLPKHN